MKRVLVVDDDEVIGQMLSATLNRKGYEASTAPGWRQASEMVETQPPDIVILDMYMPEVNGLEALELLREGFPQVGVIAISGGVGKDTLLNTARKLGASFSLAKPFTPNELLEAVQELAH